MTTYTGGHEVKGGFYLDTRRWAVENVPGKRGPLPGTGADRFVHLPTVAMLVVGPLLGGALVLFLPFIALALFVYYSGLKLGHLGLAAGRAIRASLAPAWRPGVAYLTGKPGAPAGEEPSVDAPPDGRLARLANDLEQHRHQAV